MAVDTPVLERATNERQKRQYAVPSRMEILEEEEHNARIKATYARLINPESKIEDVFGTPVREQAQAPAAVEEPEVVAAPVAAQPYRVENARADSMLFRADSTINARKEEVAEVQTEAVAVAAREEEDEDLRPTPTTIQYQTLGKLGQKTVSSTTDKKAHVFGKREKIIVAVFVAVVVALIALIIINSAVIANLNAEISRVQDSIITVRGALAGVNSDIEGIIQSALGQ